MEALLGVKARALRSPNFASALVAVSEGIMLCFIRRKAQRCCFCSRPFVSQAPEGSRSDINGTSNLGTRHFSLLLLLDSPQLFRCFCRVEPTW